MEEEGGRGEGGLPRDVRRVHEGGRQVGSADCILARIYYVFISLVCIVVSSVSLLPPPLGAVLIA